MRNKRNQQFSIMVYALTGGYVETIKRQVHIDKNGLRYCSYKGKRREVTEDGEGRWFIVAQRPPSYY